MGNRLGGSYAYDGHGRRTKITSSGETTHIQVYSQGGQLLWSERNSVGTFPATVSYGCSTGTLVGSHCVTTSTYPATMAMSCNAGDSLSGSTCTRICAYAATATYSCPSGSSCTQTSTYPATPNDSCNAGDSLNGSTCTHSSAIAATPSYSCPNGGTLTGDQCVGANSSRTAYIYLGVKQIAETVVDGVTQYAHTDALGSPVAHTDQAGAVLNRTKYEPYGFAAAGTKPGRTTAGLTTTGSAIGFTGHVNDPETDLVYMQQRYYDPIAGRFLSVDPVVTDANTGSSFNRYTYANNSPYEYVDPDGRQAWPVELNRQGKVVVTSSYGPRNTGIPGASKDHKGTDFRAPVGAKIIAPRDGKVVEIGSREKGGNSVVISNSDGSMNGFAHTKASESLKIGDSVKEGQTIGKSDKSGTKNAHLHITYRSGTESSPATGSSPTSDPMTTQFKDKSAADVCTKSNGNSC